MTSVCGIVFGGSGLLGPVWVKQLARKSDSVYVVGLGLSDDPSLSRICEEYPKKIVLIEQELTNSLRDLELSSRSIDFAVFNAAMDSVPQDTNRVLDLPELSQESWNAFLGDNVRIFVNSLNFFCRNRKPLAFGVVIGSMYTEATPRDSNYSRDGKQVFRKHPGYAASKRAIKGVMRQYAARYASEGLVLNMLSPGVVLNNQPDWFLNNLVEQIPSRRFVQKDDLMPALDFLTSSAATHMIGQELLLDGGYSLW